jgi:predicted transcriptional regulator
MLQARYEQMSPAVYTLLPMRHVHKDDGSYISFSQEYVMPCITSLVVAVGKDTLWKPLNHFILMATRDKKKPVRMVALHAIRALFTEVGVGWKQIYSESYFISVVALYRLARSTCCCCQSACHSSLNYWKMTIQKSQLLQQR